MELHLYLFQGQAYLHIPLSTSIEVFKIWATATLYALTNQGTIYLVLTFVGGDLERLPI